MVSSQAYHHLLFLSIYFLLNLFIKTGIIANNPISINKDIFDLFVEVEVVVSVEVVGVV